MTRLSRRRLLLTVATTASASASLGLATAQETTFELGASVSGWQGQSPESIADETNPTLHLTAGKEYVVSWTNLDGEKHTFAIADGQGDVLKETKVVEERGAVQTVEFTAKAEMTTYFSQLSPDQMRGDVVVHRPTTTGTANATTGGTTNATTSPTTSATTGTKTTSTATTSPGDGTATTSRPTATTTVVPDTDNDDGQPGFAVLGALGSLGAFVYLLRRRGN
ncbi:LPXTG cell wall anchor domain-containing protein [Halomicrococcus gelatinilyticus]|uniref:LPXTG cell wall anchor domain-containing protein n=1 Tax=Halomicrococcus gelatinilyticus TaxID=1702103 RepID=UPI002E0D9936